MVDNRTVKSFLDELYNAYNKREFILTDPIRFAYEIDGDIEFIAFTSALFSYGNVKAISRFLTDYFQQAGSNPFELNTIVNDKLYYRFQNKYDISSYSKVMKSIYKTEGSLLNIFQRYNDGRGYEEILKAGIIDIRNRFEELTAGSAFLLPIPGRSASKRLTMFMRWVIRKDKIDLGLWQSTFDKRLLSMPIDVHIKRSSVSLGIVGENVSPKVAVKTISEFYKKLNPSDPAKYDFALSRLGIAFDCKYKKLENCKICIWSERCIFCR